MGNTSDSPSKAIMVQVILKQVEVSSALYNLMETDRDNLGALSKARNSYFDAQTALLNLTKELLSND